LEAKGYDHSVDMWSLGKQKERKGKRNKK
jgi:hypothetical protein